MLEIVLTPQNFVVCGAISRPPQYYPNHCSSISIDLQEKFERNFYSQVQGCSGVGTRSHTFLH